MKWSDWVSSSLLKRGIGRTEHLTPILYSKKVKVLFRKVPSRGQGHPLLNRVEDLPGDDPFNHMEDADIEERQIEEESSSYADAVALTLSQEERTAKARDLIKRCASGEELFDVVRELQPSRLASSKSITTNRIIKAVSSSATPPLKELKGKILQGLGMDLEEKIPSVAELEKNGKADWVLKALGEASDYEAVIKMRDAALEGFKTVRAPFYSIRFFLAQDFFSFLFMHSSRSQASEGLRSRLQGSTSRDATTPSWRR